MINLVETRKIFVGGLSVAAVALLVIGSSATAIVPNENELVSVKTDGTQANYYSARSDIDGNGRFVVFDSEATNLVDNDSNAKADVFLRDTENDSTTLISASASGGAANGHSSNAKISYDGRYVTFMSTASDLVSGDTNGVTDVFVRDTLNNSTSIVSKTSNGVAGNNSSHNPDISADGRYVTFSSDATNFVSGAANRHIYLKDVVSGSIKLISKNSSGDHGNDTSAFPSISCSGNVIAFESSASNLSSGDTNGKTDIYVATPSWSEDGLVNVSAGGNWHSNSSAVSCDGNAMVFLSGSTNLISGYSTSQTHGYRYDRIGQKLGVVALADDESSPDANIEDISLSGDGRYVVFLSNATNMISESLQNSIRGGHVFIRDTREQTTQLISRSLRNHYAGYGQEPVISDNGVAVAYGCAMEPNDDPLRGLVTADSNQYSDIFISKTGY